MRFAPPKVGQVRLRAGRFCFGRAGRCSALTRRNAILLHGVVNCGPAKGYVWPVLAPAEGLVRAGTVLRGGAVLLQRFAFGSRRLCGSLEMSCVRFTPVFFPLSGKKRRLAMSCVSIPPGRDRHSCVLAVLARLSALVGSLRNCAFICGDLDGVTTGVGYTKRNAVFVQRSFCYKFMIRYDTAGRTLGLRAPDCAKESSTLWTLFTLRRGWVGADSRRRHPGTIGDPPDSDKRRPHCGWSGRSCITARQQVDAGTAGLNPWP